MLIFVRDRVSLEVGLAQFAGLTQLAGLAQLAGLTRPGMRLWLAYVKLTSALAGMLSRG